MADDGWISVPRGKKSRKPPPVTGTPAPSRDITPEDVKRDFDAKAKQWRKTECRMQLLRQMKWTLDQRDGAWMIERFVCIGSGSLSRDNMECRRRSMWQIVVFLDLVAYLLDFYELDRHDYGNEDKHVDNQGQVARGVWAIDPAYTELDVQFLQSVGAQVLPVEKEDSGLGMARQHVRDGTLLFEPFVDMNAHMIRDMVENDVDLYIGSSIGGLKERQGEVGQLAKKFCAGRVMKTFPVFEIDPNTFDGMSIYWKEEIDE